MSSLNALFRGKVQAYVPISPLICPILKAYDLWWTESHQSTICDVSRINLTKVYTPLREVHNFEKCFSFNYMPLSSNNRKVFILRKKKL